RRLLHDLLRLLARSIDRGLEDHLEPDAALLPDAVRAALPAARVQYLVRLVHVELPAGVLGVEAGGRVEEIRRGLAAASVDLLLHRPTVHEKVQGLAHGGIGEEGMGRLEAGPLPVDLLEGIGLIELDVLGIARGPDLHASLASLLEPPEDVVLHLEVPR